MNELFEKLWEHAELRVTTDDTYAHVDPEKLRKILREAVRSVVVPEHIDIQMMRMPVDMLRRGAETQSVVALTQSLCVTTDTGLQAGMIAMALETFFSKIQDDVTVCIYQLPLPYSLRHDTLRWNWRFAKVSGRGWEIVGQA